jgi:hypothetical protein
MDQERKRVSFIYGDVMFFVIDNIQISRAPGIAAHSIGPSTLLSMALDQQETQQEW